MNTKSKIYISIFIVFITVMIASASYAYLIRGRGVGEVLNSNVATTNQKPVYSAYSEGNIEFNITALQMSQLNVTTEAVAVDNANIYVDLTSSTDNEGTRCTYDLVWVWDSKDKYTTADVDLPYTDESGNKFPYELSIKINDQEEKDLSSYTWDEIGSTILLENEIIESSSATEKTQRQYNIEVKVYNINAAQRNLFKKSFQAHIEVQNYNCYISGAVVSYSGEYDGKSHTISVPLSNEEIANNIYYSTTTKLDKTNYKTEGTTTKPERTKAGITKVYWCTNNGDTCGINEIEIMPTNFANYIIKNVYIEDGENGLYYHDGVGTYTNANLEAGDNSYRYSGANPDNYVCFKEGCSDDEKYRIVGIFNKKVKLIKMTSVGDKVWNSSGVNTWEGSTMETYLNGEYLTNLGDNTNLIDITTWYVGGFTSTQLTNENAKGIYTAELSSTQTIERKIGLMYASDYMYAAAPTYWNLVGYNSSDATKDYRASKGKDWMFSSGSPWAISRMSDHNSNASLVAYNPNVGYTRSSVDNATRPVFSLLSSVKLISGSGTIADPYIVG